MSDEIERFRDEWREEEARQRALDETPEHEVPDPPGPHVVTVYSTGPGQEVLGRRRCECEVGREHGMYESPRNPKGQS